MKVSIDKDRIPEHVAVIMDGNGRWAQEQGAKRIFGHRNAIAAVRETIEGANELGVKYLTLYTFSTENWNRPKLEVNAIMELLVKTLTDQVPNLMKDNVRLTLVGDISMLPRRGKAKLEDAIHQTSSNTGLTLILALSYSGRWEITNTIKDIAKQVADKQIGVEDITENYVSSQLLTADFPDPELLIRTSGELRISNFLLWQLAYTELYFTDVLWPDFRKEHLIEAVVDYQQRERRFGKTGAQIKS
ncbi:isoprenyl transferase [Echinicola pacifica]|uniref:Isoprenyl transferase n=1 Tax=Echinicola pacifica TaxID=346377 RepID=A0A918UNG8_9BACT|nr:isoprenyl transferase [Echinicola pacifica]GGZ22932.1 isoprenyl transferase [Echinicola pacifica]